MFRKVKKKKIIFNIFLKIFKEEGTEEKEETQVNFIINIF